MGGNLGGHDIAADIGRVLDHGLPPRAVRASARARPVTLYERRFKRSFDVVGSLVLMLALLPVIVATSAVVLWSLGWPVLYNQPRVGRHGTHFKMFKFRTMLADLRLSDLRHPGPERRVSHKSLIDPRHTRVGGVLRRTSLDELPQLLNVLRGEMSLVGPRPELIAIRRELGSVDRRFEDVRPGMTGPWQVYSRDSSDSERRLEFDNGYVEQITLAGDLKLLAATTLAVVRRTGC